MEEEQEQTIIEEYEELAKQYQLPLFERLAEEFDIEKIGEKETSFLLREIRKAITEKTYSYLHLLENFLNPNPNPLFIFSMLKQITPKLREEITTAYNELSKLQMKAIRLDLIYTETKEAAFISESYKQWQTLKTKIDNILAELDIKNTPRQEATTKRNDYYG